MGVLTWNAALDRIMESGIDQGVLYPQDPDGTYPLGVVWEGLKAVTEKPQGAEETKFWANNMHYASLFSPETFEATLEAFTYPDEFEECDGSAEPAAGVVVGQQSRQAFGLVFRSRVGNASEGDEVSYKYHLIYACRAKPSEKAMTTINDSPSIAEFSWDLTTTPVTAGSGLKSANVITVNSATADPDFLAWLLDNIYGTAIITANLPSLEDVVTNAITPPGP